MATIRNEETTTATTVTTVAKPLGRARENGPHLADLRAFVNACEGLPDDLRVFVRQGHMGESGRYDVEIKTTWRHRATDTEDAS